MAENAGDLVVETARLTKIYQNLTTKLQKQTETTEISFFFVAGGLAFAVAACVLSMASSARCSSECGTVGPSASAVLKLITSSTFVDCWTGRSAGLAPARIWPL